MKKKPQSLQRLKRARSAKEFGTTWQTVRAIKKADDERALALIRANKKNEGKCINGAG